MTIPKITHLQFAVLSVLADGPKTGRDLRGCLSDKTMKQTRAAFYQMMSRLEEASLVKGWYTTKVVSGQTIKERQYKLTGRGIRAREVAIEFYLAANVAAILA